jgi:hypothetical protein
LRKEQINNFMASFDDLNYIDRNIIEEGLRDIIGETPGIDFEYAGESVLNESSGKMERQVNLKNIHILFSYVVDDPTKPRIGKISYVVS